MPILTFRSLEGCEYGTDIAQIVEQDLANLNITVNIQVLASSDYWSVYGSYSSNLQNPSSLGTFTIVGGSGWPPVGLTPADMWLNLVGNGSTLGNTAIYQNPIVQDCLGNFTSTTNISQIQTACLPAQKQVYNDAPYYWLGENELWYAGGFACLEEWSHKRIRYEIHLLPLATQCRSSTQ